MIGAVEQIVGPEPRAAPFASSVIRRSCSVAPWPGQLKRWVASCSQNRNLNLSRTSNGIAYVPTNIFDCGSSCFDGRLFTDEPINPANDFNLNCWGIADAIAHGRNACRGSQFIGLCIRRPSCMQRRLQPKLSAVPVLVSEGSRLHLESLARKEACLYRCDGYVSRCW
jgi:hypothetical protein